MRYFLLTGTILLSCFISVLAQTNLKGAEAEVATISKPQGKFYALVVGISDYESKLIPDLKYASADARSFSDYLKTMEKAHLIEMGTLIELYDKDATRAKIKVSGLDKISDLIFDHVITPNDMVIVYLSGHGGSYNSENSVYFPHDAAHMTDGLSSFSIKWIKSEIGKWVEDSKATVLFFFDACRSATVDVGGPEGLKQASKALERETGEILFAASQGGEPAMETSELKHGVFSYYLIDGLYGKADRNKDGKISTRELQNYVTDQVDLKTNGKQQPLIKAEQQSATILFPVDGTVMAMADVKLKLDMNDPNMVVLAMKGGSELKKAKQLTEAADKFRIALIDHRLVSPAKECAYAYFNEMTKLVDRKSLMDYETSLRIALYESAQDVMNNDLAGRRLYLTPQAGKKTSKGYDNSSSYDLKYYQGAKECLQTYVTLKPNNNEPVMYAMLEYFSGRQQTVQYQESKSLKWLRSATAGLSTAAIKYSDQSFLWQALAMAYLEDPAPDYKKATEAAIRAMNLAPRWSFPLVTLGQCSYRTNDTKNGDMYFQKAIELNPSDFTPYTILADISEEKGDTWEQLEYSKKAYAIDSSSIITNYKMGVAHFGFDQYDSARLFLDKVITKNPEFHPAYFYLTRANDMLGYTSDAESQYYDATSYRECKPCAHINLGSLLIDIGHEPEALKEFEKAADIDPKKSLAFYNQGYLLLQWGKMEEAAKKLQISIELDPDFPAGYYYLGCAFSELKNPDGARINFEKTIKVTKNEGALAAQSYAKLGKLDEAKSTLDKEFAKWNLDPNNSDDMSEYAWYYAVLQDTHQSLTWIEKALENGYRKWHFFEDTSFETVRSTPEFKSLVKKYR